MVSCEGGDTVVVTLDCESPFSAMTEPRAEAGRMWQPPWGHLQGAETEKLKLSISAATTGFER